MSGESGRSERSKRMLALEATAGAIALVGALLANGIVRLPFVLLVGWMIYVIAREVRSPGPDEAQAAVPVMPVGPWLLFGLVWVLLFLAAVIVGERFDDPLHAAVLNGLAFMIGWVVWRIVRGRRLQMPGSRRRVDRG